MKSFKQYISEAVPNRFHGEVFKQFYDMGRRGTYPWSDKLISQINTENFPKDSSTEKLISHIFGGVVAPVTKTNQDAPEYTMRFPSFRNDSKGRKQSVSVTTKPEDLEGKPTGRSYWDTKSNKIDLRKLSSRFDAINILAHEASHSIQGARARAGKKLLRKILRQEYEGDVDIFDPDLNSVATRHYYDSLGNRRRTNDLLYGIFADNPSFRHVEKAIKQQEGLGGKISNRDYLEYMHRDSEHDARVGGAIAQLAAKEGSSNQMSPEFSYKEFHRLSNPMTRRQERKTRKSFGRFVQAWQDTTGRKINTEGEKVWRLDSSSVSEFHPQPYGMKKDGSSNRGEPKDESRPFRGVYAAKNIEQIAPYALVGKKGKTEEVPWVAIHPRGKKPILHIVRSDFERDHPPVHLSEFSASEFVPRKELTRNLWGSYSTDEGDDEYIATKSVKPARTSRITNVQDFIKKHMDVKFVNSYDELSNIHKQYGENFDGDVIVNG